MNIHPQDDTATTQAQGRSLRPGSPHFRPVSLRLSAGRNVGPSGSQVLQHALLEAFHQGKEYTIDHFW